MTYYLAAAGLGIATDRAPLPAEGKVTVTFEGEFADCVCVGGRFYPIVGGEASIPASAIVSQTPVTAHALASRRRYLCDPLGRVGTEGEMIAPVRDTESEHLCTLFATLGELAGRVEAIEERLAALGERIDRTPFQFGGTI